MLWCSVRYCSVVRCGILWLQLHSAGIHFAYCSVMAALDSSYGISGVLKLQDDITMVALKCNKLGS